RAVVDREVRRVRRVAEERLLAGEAGRVPAEALDGEDDPGVVRVGGRDDARQLRAGPAAPADSRRAVGVLLHRVAGRVRADAEVGDRRDLAVVQAAGA